MTVRGLVRYHCQDRNAISVAAAVALLSAACSCGRYWQFRCDEVAHALWQKVDRALYSLLLLEKRRLKGGL